ncbi:MAG: iron complex transport system ATP-binding protein, partial [Actinomycetota bacterium]|nr:iron complex transport system ATP-binding protein [Actinomycetota bacterium]
EELLQLLSGFASAAQAPIVMVTHHVEEIPVGFTHALLLSEGKATAAGSIDDVITSENLTETFGLPLEVTSDASRFTARAS